MTRREFFSLAVAAGTVGGSARAPVIVPVHVVIDAAAKMRPDAMQYFWRSIWPEAMRDFGRCGISVPNTVQDGSVWRPNFRTPMVSGLESGVFEPGNHEPDSRRMGPRPYVERRDYAVSRISSLHGGAQLCALPPDSVFIREHWRARDAARADARHFRAAPQRVGGAVSRRANRLLCHPIVAVP